MQQLQEELIAVKLREAEANLSLKELRMKVNEIESYWEVSDQAWNISAIMHVLCRMSICFSTRLYISCLKFIHVTESM